MDTKIDNEFDLYLQEYRKYDIATRQNIIISQIKSIFKAFNEMNKSLSIDEKNLINSVDIDLDKKEYNQEEFLDMVLLLICSLQDSITSFNIEMKDLADKIGIIYKEFYKLKNETEKKY